MAEPHLLASGTRDAARTLAEVMYAWSAEGADGPGAIGNYAVRGVLPWLATSPPNVLAASTFLAQLLSLLSSPSSKIGPDFFISSEGGVQLTTSSTVNFLQLAVATVQRAPAPGTSPVQARGTDGGVAKEWQALLHRYRRLAGNQGVLAQKDVHEVGLQSLMSWDDEGLADSSASRPSRPTSSSSRSAAATTCSRTSWAACSAAAGSAPSVRRGRQREAAMESR